MRFARHIRQLDGLIDRPVAHRGLHDIKANVVENTASAFAAAIKAQYSIECDVQLTSDGEAVVFHDETVNRLTTSTGHIRGKRGADVQALDLRASKDRIQTLTELLDQVAGSVPLVVEIKSLWDGKPDLAQRVLRVSKSYRGPIAFMSFDPTIVALLAHEAPHRIRGIVADRAHDPYYAAMPIAARRNLRTLLHIDESKPHFVSFDHTGLPWQPVQSLRAWGMPVVCWTIKSAQDASRALRYCDQITFEGYLPA
jgi:glycerophosphoryl diester phosphodiesterase